MNAAWVAAANLSASLRLASSPCEVFQIVRSYSNMIIKNKLSKQIAETISLSVSHF